MHDDDVVELLRSTWELDPESQIDLEWTDETRFTATEVKPGGSLGKTMVGYFSSYGDFISTAEPEALPELGAYVST